MVQRLEQRARLLGQRSLVREVGQRHVHYEQNRGVGRNHSPARGRILHLPKRQNHDGDAESEMRL